MIPTLPNVEISLKDEKGHFALFIEVINPAKCGADWFVENRDAILQAVDRYGILFFRGFPCDSHGFEAILDGLSPEALPYLGGVSRRRFVHGTVYTANEGPQELAVVQHHEMSYHSYSPRYVSFYCQHPADSGGATTITDGRAFGRIMDTKARKVMDELDEKGVVFIRNYNHGNFKSWNDTWHTSDKTELEQKLREAHVEWEWVDDDWLRTRQRRPALIRDPISGARAVFASINLWQKQYSAKIAKVYNLPISKEAQTLSYHSTFGDDTPIPDEFIDLMHQTHGDQMVNIPWKPRDFMLINNFICAHGKEPWTGDKREIYVTLREKIDIAKLRSKNGTLEGPIHLAGI